MHQIITNILKNILTKSFFQKNISVFFIYENYTFSIDPNVKLMSSKINLKNLSVKLLFIPRSMEYF